MPKNEVHDIDELIDLQRLNNEYQGKLQEMQSLISKDESEAELQKKIIKRTLDKTNLVIVSRIKKDDYKKIIMFAKKLKVKVETGKNSSTVLLFKKPIKFHSGKVGIMTAGTSDIGVAEEARLMCQAMNCQCITSYDVGVAGIQRIFPILKKMIEEDIDCIIVAAGMEGALATLVSTMVDIPIIGIPTSVGYGTEKKALQLWHQCYKVVH